ncbi:SRPBCC family protein [Streptomyces purpureus]|uniref:SRPBCC family protein n=1 Tax=Streptomyces purpureus TaxID=1951 RepID=UPI000363340A|nr:SRPBCC family protein [Streptomyces purpureus]
MWEYERTEDVEVSRAVVWPWYSQVGLWARWDDEVHEVELDGPFAEGVAGRLTLKGQEPVPFRLTDVEEGVCFTTRTPVPGAELRFAHRLTDLPGGGTRITHQAAIEGPGAAGLVPVLAPSIEAGLPMALRSLARTVAHEGTAGSPDVKD